MKPDTNTLPKVTIFCAIELVLLPLGLAFSREAHDTLGSHIIAVASALFVGWWAIEVFSQGE